MRRSDREIKEFDEIVQVMERCDVCRLALNDEGYPYMIPLNFGMQVENGQVVLYFHGALEGTKYDLIAKDPRASFEMDCAHRLVSSVTEESCSCTMEYESVIGQGMVEILSAEEKRKALTILMKQYHKELSDFRFSEAAVAKTNVFKLTVEKLTGKRRMKKR